MVAFLPHVVHFLPQSIRNHSNPMNEAPHQSHRPGPPPKWAVVINDRLFPMAHSSPTARDILDQSGFGSDFSLVRDHGGTHDRLFQRDEVVDLAEGNVFRATPKCDSGESGHGLAPAKLAFVVDDAWEVTLIAHQTGYSLKRLLGLPDDAQLLRDLHSPHDEPVRDEDAVRFGDGPVFTLLHVTFEVKVNTKPVRFIKRRVSGLEIKETAIKQGIAIEVGFVLYRLKPDGSLGPVIRDDEPVTLKTCEEFSCVAPDDKS